MKKYQKLAKDNIDLILKAEDSLSYSINNYDEEETVEIPVFCLGSIYITRGALLVITADDKYDFNKLDIAVANSFANCLEIYQRYMDLSHDKAMQCLTLAREIKDNTHYHMKKEIFSS